MLSLFIGEQMTRYYLIRRVFISKRLHHLQWFSFISLYPSLYYKVNKLKTKRCLTNYIIQNVWWYNPKSGEQNSFQLLTQCRLFVKFHRWNFNSQICLPILGFARNASGNGKACHAAVARCLRIRYHKNNLD